MWSGGPSSWKTAGHRPHGLRGGHIPAGSSYPCSNLPLAVCVFWNCTVRSAFSPCDTFNSCKRKSKVSLKHQLVYFILCHWVLGALKAKSNTHSEKITSKSSTASNERLNYGAMATQSSRCCSKNDCKLTWWSREASEGLGEAVCEQSDHVKMVFPYISRLPGADMDLSSRRLGHSKGLLNERFLSMAFTRIWKRHTGWDKKGLYLKKLIFVKPCSCLKMKMFTGKYSTF